MKYAKFAAVVFVLYFLGYVLSPTLAPMFVKERKDENSLKVQVDYKGANYIIDLEDYRGDDLPRTLMMTKAETIPTVGGEGSKNLKVGDEVKLLNRSGKLLIIQSSDDIAKGKVDPKSTDLYQTLAKRKFEKAALIANSENNKTAPEPDKPVVPTPVAPPVAKADPVPAPPKPVVEPTPPVMPVVEPTPEPEPVAGGALSDEEIVALMKKSIESGAVKAIKFGDVKNNGWKAMPNELIDGTDYQTGLAAYQANTVFGLKVVQAKALIRNGKIERWVHAKSNIEIQ